MTLCTAGHNALLVSTTLCLLVSHFLGCNVHANWVVGCTMGSARKPQQYNYNVRDVPVAIVRVPIMAVMGTLVYGANTLCV